MTETAFKKPIKHSICEKKSRICDAYSTELITLNEGLISNCMDTMDVVASECNRQFHMDERDKEAVADTINKQIEILQVQLQLSQSHNHGLKTQLQTLML
jgi:hypothetical protein